MRNKFLIVSIVSFTIAIIIAFNNDYMSKSKRECLVMDKIISSSKYGGIFYIVLKDERNRIFDIEVSPSVYSQSIVGTKNTFYASEMQIQQTKFDNALYFWIQVLSFAIAFAFLIFYIVDITADKNER